MPITRMAYWLAAVIVACGLIPGLASAAEPRYSQWGSTAVQQPADQPVQKMIDELRALVDEAEKARAADYRFLGDLRDLASRYDRPWRVSLLFDDFSDGDFTAAPAWKVGAGSYWVEPGYGLRSTVEPPAPTAAPQGRTSERDLAAAIIGSLLSQAIGEKKISGNQQVSEAGSASIHVAQRVSNAFSVRLEMTSWKAPGRLEFDLYTGAGGASGYRLVYAAGGSPSFELSRFSARGVGVIDSSAQAVELEDRKIHALEWTRGESGEMVVTVDGTEVMRARDSGFRGPFDGFRMVNRGGDFVLRSVALHGTE